MEGRVMQGILNEREADGQTQYKVRFKGLGKEDDAWVSASEVGTKQVSNFQLRKAKKGGEGLIPVKTITKEKKREAAPAAAQGAQQAALAAATAPPVRNSYIGFYKSKVVNADPAYKRFNNLDRAPFTISAGGIAAQLNPAVAGVQFDGVENAFQFLKFLPEDLAEPEEDLALFAQHSGAVAFYLGSANAGPMTLNMQKDPALKALMRGFKVRRLSVRPGWDADSVPLMKELLQLKFGQNSRLKSLLLKTGSLKIVERSPTDAKWGDANQHKHALGPGQNLLGKLLEEVREEFKAQAERT